MPGSEATREPIVRTTSGVAPGLPGTWATALATIMVLVMLAMLLWIVAVNAFGWFWPARVSQLTLIDGEVVIGELVGRERVRGGVSDDDEGYRLQIKVGNREVTGNDFRWIDEDQIRGITTPPDVVRVVRSEYGDAFGRIVGAVDADGRVMDPDSPEELGTLLDDGAGLRAERGDLERQVDTTRRPLTRLEERLATLERSDRASTADGARRVQELTAEMEQEAAAVTPELEEIFSRQDTVALRLQTARITLEAGSTSLEVPLANVIRVVSSNTLSAPARLWHALREGVAFLFTEPREANTEGGIFPALFGTVLLVFLMSLAVVPLGVITAVYMTEYARPGLLLRLANQAVNNLAGVPSIVFGMFGLAFFIYGVGGTLDRTFFADRLPTPTFGTGGLLWASLTLALLTVPVVVVATREGLLAVPRNWREGSLALGATKWQTLRRIVLPASMPGILTGMILAVSRAAGEVAPLMLTGAVKLAPSLPVDGVPPFLHLQRKFMHLGFHIYDVSMQSPNVEAAKPMAFATTLVLLALVVIMNLAAIIVRRRLRRAYRGQAV